MKRAETCTRAALVAALLAGGGAIVATLHAAASEPMVQLSPAQSRYMEGCGGCHGILGTSSKKDIPELRGAAGKFLCTSAGREYLVRLPNVAFADMDDRELADVMNFVVFDLGGASVPAGAAKYSAAEVAALRRRPLKNAQLVQMRTVILADASRSCDR